MAANAALSSEPEHEPAPLDERVESYRRLAQIFHDVLSEQSLDSLLERIADTLAELVPYDALHVYEADEAGRALVPIHARSEWAAEVMRNEIPYGRGITGWAAERRTPVLANEAHLDPRVAFVPGTPADPEALIAVPLIARGSLKGSLNIYRIGEGASFGAEDLELATSFGDAAALALDNAQIRARLEHLAQTDSLTGLYNHRYFHERLHAELARANRVQDTVALMMLDIDDFKRVNDICGHGEGDRVLRVVGEALRSTARDSDTVCRIGGEEFAVILPSCDERDALGLAARLGQKLRGQACATDEITVSTGIALGPEHATSGRELVACAEAAMMTAKAEGKDRVVVFEDAATDRPAASSDGRDVRSIAHLKMLQSLAGRLNRLNEVSEIGDAIVDELRAFVDYHDCCVYLVDGEELRQVAVRGEHADDARAHVIPVGKGICGHVAATGKPMLVPRIADCEIAIRFSVAEGDESMIAVPLRYAQRTIGVIALSKLGIDQFDGHDLRLLEVLAGNAAVALENARLYESLRHEAENATAWLEFADAVSEAGSVDAIGRETVGTVARLMDVTQCALWLEDPHAGNYRCVAAAGYAGDPESAPLLTQRASRVFAAKLLDGRKTPFLCEADYLRQYFVFDGEPVALRASAIAPLHGYGVRGWIVVRAPEEGLPHFSDERLRLLEGLSYRTSVAIQRTVLLDAQRESAQVASALLEFARELAAVQGRDEVLAAIVALTGRMLGSEWTSVLIEEEGEAGTLRVEAAWREEGAPPPVEVGNEASLGPIRKLVERGDPFLVGPGEAEDVMSLPRQDVPVAVAPLALAYGRLGCITATMLDGLPDRKRRLLAGIANQASIALQR